MEIGAGLPPGIKGVAYEKNSHWVEFVDDAGQRIKMPATAVVLYECEKCKSKWLMLVNHGPLKCPVCGEPGATPKWREPQISFVPEEPVDGFQWPKQTGDGKKNG